MAIKNDYKILRLDPRWGMCVRVDNTWVPLSKEEELSVLVLLSKQVL